MSEVTLDGIMENIADELLRMPSQKVAAFSASCSERLIGFYEEFAKNSKWGIFPLVREALDTVWDSLAGERSCREDLERARLNVEQLTPHLAEFDLLETPQAQDACICIDVAIKWCLGNGDSSASPNAIVEYSFEALRFARCFAYTGYVDLGSAPEAKKFEEILVDDPVILREIRLQREDLALLRSQDLSRDTLINLRKKSEQNRWKSEEVFVIQRSVS